MNDFSLGENEQKLRDALKRLLDYGLTILKPLEDISAMYKNNDDLGKAILVQHAFYAYHLNRSILCVAEQGFSEVGISLLRSLFETSMNVLYIESDKSNTASIAFLLEADRKKLSVVNEWLSFLSDHPDYEEKLSPKDKMLARKNELENGIAQMENKYGTLNFMDLKARAIRIDKIKGKPDNEFSYITIYRHFSEFTHITANALNNLTSEKDGKISIRLEPSNEGIDILLNSTYGIFLSFLGTISETFKLGHEPDLDKFYEEIKALSNGKVDLTP